MTIAGFRNLQKQYPVPLDVQYRLMLSTRERGQNRLWALASVKRFGEVDCFEGREIQDYQISLFGLAWKFFCLGCRASTAQTKTYFRVQTPQIAYSLVRRLKRKPQNKQ